VPSAGGAARAGGRQAQCLHLALQLRHAHRRFGQARAVRQRGALGCAEGAGAQGVEREHAPGALFHPQRHAHAVVHGQWCAHQGVEQAVVRVGQGAVVVEAHHLAPRQDGRQARVLAHGEAPPQRLGYQPVHGHGAQVFLLQPQQHHGTAVEVRAQLAGQALQALGGRVRRGEVGQQGGVDQGMHDRARLKQPRMRGVENTLCAPSA
jgi:hypothetical protein